ncbi:MAG: restriction endonuclease subunit S [Clostridiales bacterium]|nr:restriction endonuclease subunit S [Clostridiales bacterium]
MKSNLSDICEYRKGKIDVSTLTQENYISTENMLPNKCGITLAATLPTVPQTQEYIIGDVLVSNIRPYFKKIWKATMKGGCSNDVLVFKAKKGIDQDFLYYLLADDAFFDYSMATSKGTKMPRGDKSSIMQYQVPVFDMTTQKRIAGILRAIDDKIALSNKINDNLSKQIRTLCNAWLIEYAPFGYECPDYWELTPLSSIARFIGGYSYKGEELQESTIAMATIKNFERKGGFKLDGYKELVPSGKLKPEHHAALFDTLVAHTDLTQNADVIGNAEPVLSLSGYEDIIFSMDLVKVLPNTPEISKFLVAAMLQTQQFKSHCLGYVNGTTVLHLSKKALPEYSLMLPNDLSLLKPLDEAVTSMYKQMAQNIDENKTLANLRDGLLPRLMSGELDVSDLNF